MELAAHRSLAGAQLKTLRDFVTVVAKVWASALQRVVLQARDYWPGVGHCPSFSTARLHVSSQSPSVCPRRPWDKGKAWAGWGCEPV